MALKQEHLRCRYSTAELTKRILAPQSGALTRGAFRFRFPTQPVPLIAFEHLSQLVSVAVYGTSRPLLDHQ